MLTLKPPYPKSIILIAAILALASTDALATSNYDYGRDEYVAIRNGISPDRKLAITAHGEGEYGYGNFHIYLFDAVTGKKIGPLEEITDTLDTGAGAFAAKWANDSSEVTIIYRVSRHAPLKSMTYRLARRRAVPMTKQPIDVMPANYDSPLIKYWREAISPEKTFGTPKRNE